VLAGSPAVAGAVGGIGAVGGVGADVDASDPGEPLELLCRVESVELVAGADDGGAVVPAGNAAGDGAGDVGSGAPRPASAEPQAPSASSAATASGAARGVTSQQGGAGRRT